MKETATSGGRKALTCLNARRLKPLLNLFDSLGSGWGIQPGDEIDGEFAAVNKFTGERICRTGFDVFEKAVAARCAGRANSAKAPKPQPKARPQPRTQTRPPAVRPSWPPRTDLESRRELLRLQTDLAVEKLKKHQADVRRDGLRLLREKPWLSFTDLRLYFP